MKPSRLLHHLLAPSHKVMKVVLLELLSAYAGTATLARNALFVRASKRVCWDCHLGTQRTSPTFARSALFGGGAEAEYGADIEFRLIL
jgi:hypothetical protein